jgi:hypothetical protein
MVEVPVRMTQATQVVARDQLAGNKKAPTMPFSTDQYSATTGPPLCGPPNTLSPTVYSTSVKLSRIYNSRAKSADPVQIGHVEPVQDLIGSGSQNMSPPV